jgi:hypothetical protein
MSLLYIVTALLLAQTTPATPPAPKPDPNQPLTMSGCVTRDYTDSRNATAYTFIDNVDGGRYRLKGKNLSKYSGMSVEVVGIVDTKKIKVVGGLWPSPNVAGQAGAIDPGKAAIAALPGGGSAGTGNVELPTLNVTRLSMGQGECRK